MAGRYERVNAHADDDDDHHNDTPTPTNPTSRPAIPNSPPPSFHSRASSIHNSQRPVNPDLADAFGADEDDDSDDDADDRQRLMRRNSSPTEASGTAGSTESPSGGSSRPGPERQTTQLPTTPYTPATGGASTTTTTRTSGRVYGGGIQNEGVFSNLTAKPERNDGTEKEELPPSYEQAAADAAPPYWETTILAPGLGGPDDVYIEGMPVGSIVSFIWNGMISMSFQLVGFLLTYLLHSTHAAKNGSRAGLGITLIQFGFMMKGTQDSGGDGGDGYAAPPDPNSHDFDPGQVDNSGGSSDWGSIDSSDWVAYILMLVGWFILIKSVSDYLKVRRHEMLVLQSPDRGLGIPIIATGEAPERVV